MRHSTNKAVDDEEEDDDSVPGLEEAGNGSATNIQRGASSTGGTKTTPSATTVRADEKSQIRRMHPAQRAPLHNADAPVGQVHTQTYE